MEKYWIKKEQLDEKIKDIFPEIDNEETMREFIRSSEEEFGLSKRDIDNDDVSTLNVYIEKLDYLWTK